MMIHRLLRILQLSCINCVPVSLEYVFIVLTHREWGLLVMQQHYFSQKLASVLLLFGLDSVDGPAVLWSSALY